MFLRGASYSIGNHTQSLTPQVVTRARVITRFTDRHSPSGLLLLLN